MQYKYIPKSFKKYLNVLDRIMPNEIEELDKQMKSTKIHPLGAINDISDVNMHSQIEDHYAMAPIDEEEEKLAKHLTHANHRTGARDQTFVPVDNITIDSKEAKEAKRGYSIAVSFLDIITMTLR